MGSQFLRQGPRLSKSGLVAASLVCSLFPAFAQAAGQETQPSQAAVEIAAATADEQAQSATTESATQLPSVTVTGESDYLTRNSRSATKTDTPLQNLPQSVSVVPRKLIEDTNMRSMSDALRYVPGASPAQGEGNRDAVVLRGANTSTSDFFADGIRDDVQYYRDFYNVERVEVLKGASALAFGRGGSGGVVNRVMRAADGSTVREIGAQSGSYNDRRVTADVGQKLVGDLDGRVTGMYEYSDSYRDYVKLERMGINPTLGYKLGDKTKLLFSYEYFSDRRTNDRGIPSQNGLPFDTGDNAFFGNPDDSVSDAAIHATGITLDHAFSDGLTLRNALRVSYNDKTYKNAYAGSSVSGAGTYTVSAYRDDTERVNVFNQTDLVWKVATGALKHTLLAGAEFGHQQDSAVRFTAANLAGVSAAAPTIFTPFAFNTASVDLDSKVTIAAIYLQDQLEFSPEWSATFGARFDSFGADVNNKRTATHFYRYDGLVSPRVGLVYKPVQPLSLYASYSINYVPVSGDQLRNQTNLTAALNPEEIANYEVGAKWMVRETLALTLATFRAKRKDSPIAVSGTSTINSDGISTDGVELGINGNITSRWSIAGGYTYQNASFDTASTANAKGARPANVPFNTASLWNRYDFTGMWGAGIGVFNRGSMYAAPNNTVRLPGYTRVDGAIFFTLNPQFGMQLNMENLLDRGYVVNAHNNDNIQPGAPFNARVSATYRF